MAASDSKSYLGYLNELVDEHNNTWHYSIGKKPIDADNYAFAEETKTNPKASKFKVGDRARITKYKNIFSKGHTEHWSMEVFVIDSVLKTNTVKSKI